MYHRTTFLLGAVSTQKTTAQLISEFDHDLIEEEDRSVIDTENNFYTSNEPGCIFDRVTA